VSREKSFAHDVSDELGDYGIDGFVAHDDIPETAPWRAEILEAIDSCDAFALFLHDGFVESRWCDQEVGIAFEKGKLLVPVCFTYEDPHGFASEFQKLACVDLDADDTARKIYKALVNDQGDVGDKIKLALIRSVRDSRSFTQSAERARRMNRYIHESDWRDPELVEALRRTLYNDQVLNGTVAKRIVDRILEDNP
jgi:hypothetical protein